jgi:hypothetical protein
MADKRRTAQQLTEQELDQLAAITPADILRAQQAWREDARPAFKTLLDAAPDDAEPLP